MKRALALALTLALTPACVRLETATRVERGPLLRTFHRPEVVEGGVKAELSARWPSLDVELTAYDTCRDLTVDEYPEERITERTSTASGPALSTGISTLLLSGILFVVSMAVSGAPDRTRIDAAGNFGPSPRQYVQGIALGSGIVGVPALGVGLITSLRTGEDVVTTKVEQVVSQKDQTCNFRPLTGPVRLEGEEGLASTDKNAVDGKVSFDATELKRVITGVTAFGRTAELGASSLKLLDAFNGCLETGDTAARGLETLDDETLGDRAAGLRRCRTVRGDAVNDAIKALEREQDRRRGAPGPEAKAPASFDEARAQAAPRLTLRGDSPDVKKLAQPESVIGQSALLEAVVQETAAPGVLVVQSGDVRLFLSVPAKASWASELRNGNRIEAVVVLSGAQTVNGRTLPSAVGVWARTRF